jgi:protein-S-isoprenylcysteine O-methyltransferase Ste14
MAFTLNAQPITATPFWLTLVVWAIGERILMVRDLRWGVWRGRQDRGSFYWVVFGIFSGFIVAIALSSNHALNLPHPAAWLVPGLIVAWAGLLLRVWAVLTLGRSFTTRVVVRSEQRVVASGPYRLVRHPSYLGLLIMFLGLGLALGDLAAAVALVVLPAIGLIRRILVEEAALRDGLGDSYIAYCSGRARLIPGVW